MSKLQTFTVLFAGLGGVLGSSWGLGEGMTKYLKDEASLPEISITSIKYGSVGVACWPISIPLGGVVGRTGEISRTKEDEGTDEHLLKN